MENINKNPNENTTEMSALEKYRANLTPEQRKENALKAAATKRKNRLERKVIKDELEKQLGKKVKIRVRNPETGEIEVKCTTINQAMIFALLNDAVDPENRNRLETVRFIRDTLGEKPVEKIQGDSVIEIVLSDDLKKYAE